MKYESFYEYEQVKEVYVKYVFASVLDSMSEEAG